jgi:hypothetical protein
MSIIFLNKLKIVEITKKKEEKIKTKCLWLRLWGPSEIHRSLLSSPGPGRMYRLNSPLIGPGWELCGKAANTNIIGVCFTS